MPIERSANGGIFGLEDTLETARVVVLPVPFDATTSYHHGTARGPAAVLRASHHIDLFDIETGRPYRAGIYMQPEAPSVQAWNATARIAANALSEGDISEGDISESEALARINDTSRAVERYVATRTGELLDAGKLVCLLGGDHSTSLGCIKEHVRRYPKLGILHIDAHADLRRAYQGYVQSHGSIMYNVLTDLPQLKRLVQVGIRDLCEEELERIEQSSDRVRTFFDAHLATEKLSGKPWTQLCERIVSELPDDVYVSFDIDGLDPTLCPHTGTPVPGGLSFHEATALLKEIVESGRRIVGLDLSEVSPPPAGAGSDDDWDANVGARLLYKMIGFALNSQKD